MTPSKYQRAKARARDAAIIWQLDAFRVGVSYGDIFTAAAYFSKLARRYGLTREFRENGII